MPSLTHDAILELFRRRPALALELLRDLMHLSMPDLAHFRVGDTDVSEILPTERKADLVLLFADTPGAPPAHVLVIEAQLAIDQDKRRSWWWYLVGIHTRHRCDAVLVVVTPSAAVAAWAAQPIPLGHPGAWLTPIVIGPEQIPIIRDESAALEAPELAVLSTLVHGQSEAAFDIATAALAGVRRLDDERVRLYTDFVIASLHTAARALLEGLMANTAYQYQSDFAKRHVAEGEAKGRAEGEARGRAEGKALAILSVLATRGLDVPPRVRDRIVACDDVATLEAWLTRAVVASSAENVLAE